MKRFLIAFVALFVATLSFAASPIKVKSGSLPSLSGKKVFIEYDYSKMKILDEDSKKTMSIQEFCKLKGEDWVRDMGKDDVDAQDDFKKTLVGKLGKIAFVDDKSAADYILVVNVDTFSYGNPFAFGAFMSKDVQGFFIGSFDIKDANGNKVAELSCNKIQGTGGYNWTMQKCRVYVTVAKALASVLKKAK